MAAQETLADFITGIVIMVDQPFRLGDRVDIKDLDTWGDVTEIGWRSTRILTRDHRMVAVPNRIIAIQLLVNHSFPE